MRRAMMLGVVLGLAGCVHSVGRPIDFEWAKTVKPGQTTRAEAEGVLGRPYMEHMDGTGNSTLAWIYAAGTIYDPNREPARSLTLTFDRAGKLTNSVAVPVAGPSPR